MWVFTVFTVLGRDSKFATVLKDKILAVNEAGNKYQERGKIWLVGVYWSVEKILLTEFATKS